MRNTGVWIMAAVLVCGSMTAVAADIVFSGFSTVGYARSDQAYRYQRFVDERGTLKRDSVLGVQMDAKLNNQFGVTVQAKLAPSLQSDQDIDTTISWAFLSWRPTNDWLVRVGRLRVPPYLNSENMDVGTTFDFAKLPAEVYSSVQTTDGDGIFISKTWNIDESELTLNGYWATAKMHYRYYRRDTAPPPLSAALSSGSYFVPVKTTSRGLGLTLQHDENVFRATLHDIDTQITDTQLLPVTFPFVEILPGAGYFQTTNLLPGPGVQSADLIRAQAYTLGADVMVGNGFRVMGEYVRRKVFDVITGPDSQGAYLAVLKPIGAWTPYVNVARLKSTARTRDLYNQINGNTVSASTLLNASQRAGADGINAYDQTTWAVGTSYRLNPTSKLKAEWARTHTGDMSLFVDAPPGGESGKQTINVFSLSYNVVF